jgi:hypothetical protein
MYSLMYLFYANLTHFRAQIQKADVSLDTALKANAMDQNGSLQQSSQRLQTLERL